MERRKGQTLLHLSRLARREPGLVLWLQKQEYLVVERRLDLNPTYQDHRRPHISQDLVQ